MGSVLYDIRYAIRVLFRNPGFSAVAILSLALGIGANTAVFSLVDTLLFRPTGARDDQQVVQISARSTARRGGIGFSYPDYLDLKRQNRVFSGVFLVSRHGFMVAENGRTAVTFGETVSPDYFDVMGVQPAMGRPFLPSEDTAGSPEVVVISHGYWQRHFGGDRGIIGKTVTINFRPATIVGVAPRNFQGVAVIGSEIWVAAKNNGARQERYFEMAGRLRPGVSINQAQAEMDGLVKALGEAYPDKDKAVPGVRAVSSTSRVPLSTSGGGMTQNVSVDGSPATPGNATVAVRYNVVGTDYFAVMGTRLLRGRYFTEADDERTPKVALINETFARRFWPNQDPVGKHFRASGRDTADWEVAGVTQDGKYNKIDELPQPFVYFPLAQMFRSELTLIVETAVDPASISGTVMREVRAMNPAVTLDAMTLKEHLRAAMWEQDAVTKLIAGFGGMALFLTCIGLYGVVGYTVNRRTREIGVRMALGASRRTVLAQVLKQGLFLALSGSVAGLAVAFVLVRFLSAFLFGVSPFDPLVFAFTTLLLIAVTLLATFVPARRAMSVNPVIALRHE